MTRLSGSDIAKGIRANQKPRHDTLYCSRKQKRALLGTVSSLDRGRADNLHISGLNVIAHERFVQPIICQKGEIFDLTEDFL